MEFGFNHANCFAVDVFAENLFVSARETESN